MNPAGPDSVLTRFAALAFPLVGEAEDLEVSDDGGGLGFPEDSVLVVATSELSLSEVLPG